MIEDLLDEFFVCDLSSGKVFWRIHNGTKCRRGGEAGTSKKDGRVLIRLKGRAIYRYHIIWYFANGVLPKDQIDHIDRNPSNDSIGNLREVNNENNSWNKGLNSNNTSGAKGVYLNSRGKYIANIHIRGKTKYLGTFSTLEEAVSVRNRAEEDHKLTI